MSETDTMTADHLQTDDVAYIDNMDAALYHSQTDAVSHSMFKLFVESRRKYKAAFLDRTLPAKSSRVMDKGTVGHAAILEPHIIERVCVEIPDDVLAKDGSRRGKKWDAWTEENASMIQMTTGELRDVRGMYEAVYDNPLCRKLLEADGPTEASIFWADHRREFARRIRPDKLSWPFIVDVKTTEQVLQRRFRYVASDFGYDTQGAFYCDGCEAYFGSRPTPVIIAVESNPPYLVRPYVIDDMSMLGAKLLVDQHLDDLAECYHSGDWSDPEEQQITELTLPTHKYQNLEAFA